MVDAGKVLYLGISDTPAWVVVKANEYARQHGLTQFSVYQGKWNAATRDFERDILPMCESEGMGIAPWGTLGSGAFKTTEVDGVRNAAISTEKNVLVTQKLAVIAKQKGTMITSLVSYHLITPVLTKAISYTVYRPWHILCTSIPMSFPLSAVVSSNT